MPNFNTSIPPKPDNICVIGAKDTILPFKALGVEIIPIEASPQATKKIETLLAEKAVVFFTPELFPYLQPLMEKTRKQPTPCFVVLPTTKEELSIQRLKKLVAHAVGAELI